MSRMRHSNAFRPPHDPMDMDDSGAEGELHVREATYASTTGAPNDSTRLTGPRGSGAGGALAFGGSARLCGSMTSSGLLASRVVAASLALSFGALLVYTIQADGTPFRCVTAGCIATVAEEGGGYLCAHAVSLVGGRGALTRPIPRDNGGFPVPQCLLQGRAAGAVDEHDACGLLP
jgi:hypothetical protein